MRFNDLARVHDIGELKIKISGCINACGHHHIGAIGILGEAIEEARKARLVILSAAAVAVAGLAGLASIPKAKAASKRWHKAASMFDLGPQPLMVVIAERHQDGWYETQQQTMVFIDKDESGKGYRAMSATWSNRSTGSTPICCSPLMPVCRK